MYLKFKKNDDSVCMTDAIYELCDILEINTADAQYIVDKISLNGYYNIGFIKGSPLLKIVDSTNFIVIPTTSEQNNKEDSKMKVLIDDKHLAGIEFCCSYISKYYEEGYINIDKHNKTMYIRLEGHKKDMGLNYCPHCGSEIFVNDISEI